MTTTCDVAVDDGGLPPWLSIKALLQALQTSGFSSVLGLGSLSIIGAPTAATRQEHARAGAPGTIKTLHS